jgi:MFS family permease
MTEGAIADWSGIYLSQLKMPDSYLGFGYAAFSLFMMIGRFSGDYLMKIKGYKIILRAGLTFAIIGLVLISLISNTSIVVLGFALTGIGLSCIVPILFFKASNIEGYTIDQGIAIVSLVGYTGFLLGPAIMGFISELKTLNASFIFILITQVVVLLISLTKKFRTPGTE